MEQFTGFDLNIENQLFVLNFKENRCYPELAKCGFFPANTGVQTNLYRKPPNIMK